MYAVRVIDATCDTADAAYYSAPFVVETSLFGDIVSDCTSPPCGPPDGFVNVISDVVAVLTKFSNLPGAPIKARADLHPVTPDRNVSILDVLYVIEAFSGSPYPFDHDPAPCPGRP